MMPPACFWSIVFLMALAAAATSGLSACEPCNAGCERTRPEPLQLELSTRRAANSPRERYNLGDLARRLCWRHCTTRASIEHGLWVKFRMMFSRHLRDRVRQGKIRCSVRIWTRPHVKVGGWYPMEEGHIVVDSIALISIADVTRELARESGFDNVDELLRIARHGRGDNVYLIRFHYMPPGAVDPPTWVGPS